MEVAPSESVSRGVDVSFGSVDFDSAAYYRPILEYNGRIAKDVKTKTAQKKM